MLLKSLRCPCDAGNSAPMEHNLAKYLAKHPECEVYCGQDVHGGKGTGGNGARGHSVEVVAAKPRAAGPIQKRVTLWHKVQKRKVVGNAAPLEKNVHTYLAKHPEYEIYDAHGHEKEKDIQRAVEKRRPELGTRRSDDLSAALGTIAEECGHGEFCDHFQP